MTGDDIIQDFRDRAEKALEDLRRELGKIRTGRANAAMLEGITVESYGSRMPLNAVASISVPDARTMLLKPFDKSQIQAIEKGINESDLGIAPQNDGNVIRLPVPPLTEERRKEIARAVRRRGEDRKIGVRNLRRDANERVKALEKDGEISTDDEKRFLDQIQKETDAAIAKVDEVIARKEKEVMEI